ncbi:ScbR family autoregulator-binding transcription factor [Timonella sp. A28]|uniref:ScbR family autoregulator-binding transcription factor n=1 Tax=Timonella sp. A28 TaxID=3442640 RepID=UPI003EB7488C
MELGVREQQRQRTQAAILDVAAQEFDRRGYADVSLSDIAAKVGVTKGAVYFHFPSKAALATKIIEKYFVAWQALLGEIDAQELKGIPALRWLSHAVAERYQQDPGVRAPLRLMREADIIGLDFPTPFVAWINVVTEKLEEAHNMGVLQDHIDVYDAAWQIVASFFGAQEVSHHLRGRDDLVERVDKMWQLLLPALTVHDSKP